MMAPAVPGRNPRKGIAGNRKRTLFFKGGKPLMNTLQYFAICLYYYGREAVKHPLYFITILYLFFIVHKLATWTAWVIGL